MDLQKGWTDRWMGGWIDGWMDRWMNGQMGGWTDPFIEMQNPTKDRHHQNHINLSISCRDAVDEPFQHTPRTIPEANSGKD